MIDSCILAWSDAAKTADQRWEIINVLLALPKSKQIEFVKSEQATKLFGALKGSDRMFVRLAIDQLPGCKRRVKEIFGADKQSFGAKRRNLSARKRID